jgi:hypothetical protein
MIIAGNTSVLGLLFGEQHALMLRIELGQEECKL